VVALLAVTDDRVTLEQRGGADRGGGSSSSACAAHGSHGRRRHADRAVVDAVARAGSTGVRGVPGGQSYLQPVAVRGGRDRRRRGLSCPTAPCAAVSGGPGSRWSRSGSSSSSGPSWSPTGWAPRTVRATRHLRGRPPLRQDDLAVRVTPQGPAGLKAVGRSFNAMADRMVGLLRAERNCRRPPVRHRVERAGPRLSSGGPCGVTRTARSSWPKRRRPSPGAGWPARCGRPAGRRPRRTR